MIITRRKALFIPLAPAIIGLARPSAAQLLTTGAGKAASSGPPPTAFKWNSSDAGATSQFANGDRDYIAGTTPGTWESVRSTVSKSTGKWYVEFTIPTASAASTPNCGIGLADGIANMNIYLGSADSSGLLFAFPGSTFNGGIISNVTATPGGDTVTAGDIYQMWWDLPNGFAWLGKNGSPFSGMSPSSGTGPWVSWPAGGSWFVAATQNGNSTATIRLASTATFSPGAGGFTVLNA